MKHVVTQAGKKTKPQTQHKHVNHLKTTSRLLLKQPSDVQNCLIEQ